MLKNSSGRRVELLFAILAEWAICLSQPFPSRKYDVKPPASTLAWKAKRFFFPRLKFSKNIEGEG